jgi:hypothetical protein
MNDESDNSNIPSSIICSVCLLTSVLAEYGTGMEWPIIGFLSVILSQHPYFLLILCSCMGYFPLHPFPHIYKEFISSSIISSYNSRFLLTNATYFLVVQTDSSFMVCVTFSSSSFCGLPVANAPDVLQPCGLLYYP